MGVVAGIAGIVLALMMMGTGVMKLRGHDMVKANMDRLGVNERLTRMIGIDEVLASVGIAIGLFADGSSWEWVGFLAGVGVIVLMLGALFYHQRAGDPQKEMVPAAAALVLAVLYLAGIMAR